MTYISSNRFIFIQTFKFLNSEVNKFQNEIQYFFFK